MHVSWQVAPQEGRHTILQHLLPTRIDIVVAIGRRQQGFWKVKEIQTSYIFAALDAIIFSGMKAMKLMRFLANADESILQSIMEDVCRMKG